MNLSGFDLATLQRHQNGAILSGFLKWNRIIDGIGYKGGCTMLFHDNEQVARGVLSYGQTIQGKRVECHMTVQFGYDGELERFYCDEL